MTKNKDINKKFNEWIDQITRTKSLESVVAHLREHVGPHYDRYDRTKSENLDIWLVDILNFMHILDKKGLNINKEDLLFKLCLHFKKSGDGPKPSFDVDDFIKNYRGRFRKFNV